jgi:hypothetical protein
MGDVSTTAAGSILVTHTETGSRPDSAAQSILYIHREDAFSTHTTHPSSDIQQPDRAGSPGNNHYNSEGQHG